MADPSNAAVSWSPWRVAKSSGFEVSGPGGEVGLVQIDRSQFLASKASDFYTGHILYADGGYTAG